MRRPLLVTILFVSILVPAHWSACFAYILPAYSISQEDWQRSTEEVVADLKTARDEISKETNLGHINEYLRNPKLNLSAKGRSLIAQYKKLNTALEFWNYILKLKSDLMKLDSTADDKLTTTEADEIAKITINTIYLLSREYKIFGSALINNFLINRGIKQKGFCYHYVDALRKALSVKSWKAFDIYWGTAWEGSFRENNALVITARNAPFGGGIALDPWRTASKPFWTKVNGDRFPWVEAKDVKIDD